MSGHASAVIPAGWMAGCRVEPLDDTEDADKTGNVASNNGLVLIMLVTCSAIEWLMRSE